MIHIHTARPFYNTTVLFYNSSCVIIFPSIEPNVNNTWISTLLHMTFPYQSAPLPWSLSFDLACLNHSILPYLPKQHWQYLQLLDNCLDNNQKPLLMYHKIFSKLHFSILLVLHIPCQFQNWSHFHRRMLKLLHQNVDTKLDICDWKSTNVMHLSEIFHILWIFPSVYILHNITKFQINVRIRKDCTLAG